MRHERRGAAGGDAKWTFSTLNSKREGTPGLGVPLFLLTFVDVFLRFSQVLRINSHKGGRVQKPDKT